MSKTKKFLTAVEARNMTDKVNNDINFIPTLVDYCLWSVSYEASRGAGKTCVFLCHKGNPNYKQVQAVMIEVRKLGYRVKWKFVDWLICYKFKQIEIRW